MRTELRAGGPPGRPQELEVGIWQDLKKTLSSITPWKCLSFLLRRGKMLRLREVHPAKVIQYKEEVLIHQKRDS